MPSKVISNASTTEPDSTVYSTAIRTQAAPWITAQCAPMETISAVTSKTLASRITPPSCRTLPFAQAASFAQAVNVLLVPAFEELIALEHLAHPSQDNFGAFFATRVPGKCALKLPARH